MAFRNYIPLIARIFIAVIFIQSGFSKLMNFGGTQEVIAGKGLPLAGLVTVFTILFELGGGAAVITGFKARIGAILLMLFLIPATFVFHNFLADPSQLTQFLKNLAIMGGLLQLITYGPGPLSLEGGDQETLALTSSTQESA